MPALDEPISKTVMDALNASGISLTGGFHLDEVYSDKNLPFCSVKFQEENSYPDSEGGRAAVYVCRIVVWGTDPGEVKAKNSLITDFLGAHDNRPGQFEDGQYLLTGMRQNGAFRQQQGLRYKDGKDIFTYINIWHFWRKRTWSKA